MRESAQIKKGGSMAAWQFWTLIGVVVASLAILSTSLLMLSIRLEAAVKGLLHLIEIGRETQDLIRATTTEIERQIEMAD